MNYLITQSMEDTIIQEIPWYYDINQDINYLNTEQFRIYISKSGIQPQYSTCMKIDVFCDRYTAEFGDSKNKYVPFIDGKLHGIELITDQTTKKGTGTKAKDYRLQNQIMDFLFRDEFLFQSNGDRTLIMYTENPNDLKAPIYYAKQKWWTTKTAIACSAITLFLSIKFIIKKINKSKQKENDELKTNESI